MSARTGLDQDIEDAAAWLHDFGLKIDDREMGLGECRMVVRELFVRAWQCKEPAEAGPDLAVNEERRG